MPAIDRERFVIAGLREFRAARILVDVTEMPNGVGKCERVAIFAANGDGFFVKRPRSVAVPQVSFDLAESLECLDQFVAHASLATECHGLDEIPVRIGHSILSSLGARPKRKCLSSRAIG